MFMYWLQSVLLYVFRVLGDPAFFPGRVAAVFAPPFFFAWKSAVRLHHLFLRQAAALCQVAGARKLVLPG